MVEVRDVGAGRFEVYAQGWHWEAFLDADRAHAVARDVAAGMSRELGVATYVIDVPFVDEPLPKVA
ncbi:hypothetical protein [Luteimonas sp. MHLX1A]|uniref:hypothetical protein n=1 Tax=Alterluteimonas muca TaxID=2878684 RepID=UPI001E3E88FC|nr:hypothetical protein [Luteimonas sp. MHLX1A]MCD9046840.1 hypothetical protein [Luteimonas sp. MHLX1A]